MGNQPQQNALASVVGVRPSGNPERSDDPQAREMMMSLSQNPTPDNAQSIAKTLNSMGNPHASEVAGKIMQLSSNPQQLQQFATIILQKLSE